MESTARLGRELVNCEIGAEMQTVFLCFLHCFSGMCCSHMSQNNRIIKTFQSSYVSISALYQVLELTRSHYLSSN